MKKKSFCTALALLFLIVGAEKMNAQATIGSQADPQAFSLLEISTASKKGGLRLPQLTTAERNALNLSVNPAEAKGLVIYNTDNDCVEYWNLTKWISLCSGSSSVVIKDGSDNDPFDPENPITEPSGSGSSVFPKEGGVKGPFTPNDTPACGLNPPYRILLILGGEYAKIMVNDPATGAFSLSMNENTTVRERYAIVRVVNNCTGEYRDFTFSQEAQNVGVYPNPAGSNVSADGENRGPFAPEANSETCPSPGTWEVTANQTWCSVNYNPATGIFSLLFQTNPSILPRTVVVTVKNIACNKQTTYSITQNGNNISLNPDNTTGNLPEEGGETAIATPEGTSCTNTPTYSLSLVSGASYAQLIIVNAQTGAFRVGFNANTSIYERQAVVRITDNCTGTFRDYTYTQAGSNCVNKAISSTGNLSQTVQQGTAIATVRFTSSSPISVTGNTAGITVSGYGSNSVTISGTPASSGSTQFVASTGNAGCTNESKTFMLTVTADPCATPPTTPTGSDVARCGAGTVTLTAGGATGSETYRWYDAGGTMRSEGSATYTTPSISATTTYYVAKYNTSTGCETAQGNRKAIAAIVNMPPYAGTISGGAISSLPGTLQLTRTGGDNGGVWTSSDPSIATVNQSGLVTGVKFGSVTINYTVSAIGCSSSVATSTITVGCGAYTAPGVWKAFMCHNLGANQSLDPFTPAAGIHGDKYKWGVATAAFLMINDSHIGSIPNWPNITVPPSTDADWNMNTANPCPTGYRVPTRAEWEGVLSLSNNTQTYTAPNTWGNDPENFSSGVKIGEALFLPGAGCRRESNGVLMYRGRYGYYWSTSAESTTTIGFSVLVANGYVGSGYDDRSFGYSVRCIAE